MPKSKSIVLAASDNGLPRWSDCELAVDEKRATALQQFIYDYEPSDADQWRKQLAAVVNEVGLEAQRGIDAIR